MKYSSRENKTEKPQETTQLILCVGMCLSKCVCIFFNMVRWSSERKAGCDAACSYVTRSRTSCDVGEPHCLSPIDCVKTPQYFLCWWNQVKWLHLSAQNFWDVFYCATLIPLKYPWTRLWTSLFHLKGSTMKLTLTELQRGNSWW